MILGIVQQWCLKYECDECNNLWGKNISDISEYKHTETEHKLI